MKKTACLVLITFFMLHSAAQAPGAGIPGIPHQFYGSVDFQNGAAPDGVSIEAWIGGVKVAECETSDGRYGYSPDLFFVEDPSSDYAGEAVSFRVDGTYTGESWIFVNGGNTELDLSVPKNIIQTTTTTKAGGGSSGGGSYSRSSSGGSSGGGVGGSAAKESCFDGIKNCHDGLCEVGVDCGGPCDPCMSCFDEIQNQGEDGVDCGGPCPPCGETTTTTLKATVAKTLFIEEGQTTTTQAQEGELMAAAPAATGKIISSAGGILTLFVFLVLVAVFTYRLMGE